MKKLIKVTKEYDDGSTCYIEDEVCQRWEGMINFYAKLAFNNFLATDPKGPQGLYAIEWKELNNEGRKN